MYKDNVATASVMLKHSGDASSSEITLWVVVSVTTGGLWLTGVAVGAGPGQCETDTGGLWLTGVTVGAGPGHCESDSWRVQNQQRRHNAASRRHRRGIDWRHWRKPHLHPVHLRSQQDRPDFYRGELCSCLTYCLYGI